jgi:hypothetical protein
MYNHGIRTALRFSLVTLPGVCTLYMYIVSYQQLHPPLRNTLMQVLRSMFFIMHIDSVLA